MRRGRSFCYTDLRRFCRLQVRTEAKHQRFRGARRVTRARNASKQVTELLVRRNKLGKRHFRTTLDAQGQLT